MSARDLQIQITYLKREIESIHFRIGECVQLGEYYNAHLMTEALNHHRDQLSILEFLSNPSPMQEEGIRKELREAEGNLQSAMESKETYFINFYRTQLQLAKKNLEDYLNRRSSIDDQKIDDAIYDVVEGSL